MSIVDKKNTKDTYELNKVTPTKFTITKKPLQFKVDSEQKVKTDGTKAQPIEISCTTEAPVPATIFRFLPFSSPEAYSMGYGYGYF